jgi:hypothetical protein
MFTDISKERAASIYRTEDSSPQSVKIYPTTWRYVPKDRNLAYSVAE